jgi:FKBP-type peptidyl-prolyl cis-trans isomerase FklB
MQKSLTIVLQLLAAGMMLLGHAPAQTPAATTTPAAPAKTAQGTAAKKTTTGAKPATAVLLKTQKDKASYAVGMSIGTGLHRQGVPVDAALVARGLRDGMTGAKPLLTDDEMKTVLTQLQGQVREQQQAKMQEQQAKSMEAAAGNKKIGDAFLAANKTKDGVVTLPSGLQYKILTAGTGPKPAATDTVSCNYRGTFIDGNEFDSSKGTPISFAVTGVIKGWTEALQLMPVGSKWQLFIPSDLAYGDGGRPGIPPGSTLIFDVELVSIGEQKK